MPKKRGRQTAKLSPPEEGSYIVEGLQPLAVDVSTISLDPKNARQHGDADLAAIAGSLQKYGQRKPLVVNRTSGVIIAGNGTYTAAVDKLGWSQIAVVFVDDDANTATGYAIADNRTAELSKWDDDRLAEAIAMLQCQDEDFAELLQLDDLLPKDSSDEGGAQIPVVFGVTIDCKSEAVQKQVYQLLVPTPRSSCKPCELQKRSRFCNSSSQLTKAIQCFCNSSELEPAA